ncbi:hypothetical protein GOBAR_AA02223 [Gossypium barbadense]|uniref:Uncharacterized protein n=1 Tax=Gossypium barbadense TaxID=3634 RepID=A0A2P5YRY4_GOSBA|nr:hypothetical protein GOBAR_AA02223 [Gossypium barbadense]
MLEAFRSFLVVRAAYQSVGVEAEVAAYSGASLDNPMYIPEIRASVFLLLSLAVSKLSSAGFSVISTYCSWRRSAFVSSPRYKFRPAAGAAVYPFWLHTPLGVISRDGNVALNFRSVIVECYLRSRVSEVVIVIRFVWRCPVIFGALTKVLWDGYIHISLGYRPPSSLSKNVLMRCESMPLGCRFECMSGLVAKAIGSYPKFINITAEQRTL